MFAEPVFYALGLSTALYGVFKLFNFARIYLRSSSLPRYLRSDGSAWALVTGASDGIGAAFATELCARGFNIVLHGRNAAKLTSVRDRILQANPSRQVIFAVADAATPDVNIQPVLDAVKDKNLTVLINNVGGIPMDAKIIAHAADTPDRIDTLLNLNVRWPLHLTRALLPQLQANKPGLIINLSSFAAVSCMPWGSIYSGAKAFNQSWSGSLAMELEAEGRDIEVLCLMTGQVNTYGNPATVGAMTPTPEAYVNAALKQVGCGLDAVAPWAMHAVGLAGMMSIPQGMRHRVMSKAISEWNENFKAESAKRQ